MQQRNIVGVFEVGLADDSRASVRTSAIMPDRELFQHEHAPATACKFIGGGATHTAGAQNDDVEILHRLQIG